MNGTRWVVTRRDFLKTSAIVGLTLGSLPQMSDASGHIRFGMVTDTHYSDSKPRGTRFYRESSAKMKECVDLMNQERVDFLVELGDFKDQDTPPEEARTLAYLQTIEQVYREFRGKTYHVLGNHDVDSLSKSQFLSHVTNTGIPADRGHYSFDVEGNHFVVLDANYRSDGLPYDHGAFDWTDANIPSHELEWLAQDLASSSSPTIVFIHQLLDGEGAHYVNNAEEVRKVLEQSGQVLAVFQGHQHAGQYHHIGDIHYYTLQAMVEGSGQESSAYAVVEVRSDNNLMVTGYRRVEDTELA